MEANRPVGQAKVDPPFPRFVRGLGTLLQCGLRPDEYLLMQPIRSRP